MSILSARVIGQVRKRDLDIPVSPTMKGVLDSLHNRGHSPLIVGGAVRDAMMGEKPKDIDVEVYGTSYDDLAHHLKQHGKVNLVGKAFGVVKFTDPDGNDYDFSLPRRDNKTGVGHRDFATEFDPDITPKEAASRRDFTFNSMAYDPVKGELHDYFGGEKDLNDRVIRHTSDAFSEDPLRVLRGMQFAARFGMKLHPDTAKECQRIADQHETLPKERVGEEFMKLATKGKEPGAAIDYLHDSGWSKNFPALHDLRDVPQEPEWHPEGDVASHTKHAMNAAAKIADREGLSGDDRATVVFGAMCHDMGKSTHTQADGDRITSHGHDQAGEPIAKEFLDSIGIKPAITSRVGPLVREHMQHLNYENGVSPKAVRRLAERLHPASIKELSHVMEADHSGRPPMDGGIPKGTQNMLDAAEKSHVTDKPMEKLIQGRDVLPYFPDREPGPHIGEVVKDAYQAQLDGEINSPDEAQEWLRKRFSKTRESAERKPRERDDPRGPKTAICAYCDGALVETGKMNPYWCHQDSALAVCPGTKTWGVPKTGSWADVRHKAMRIRNSGGVHIISIEDDVITAEVDGDHGQYEVLLYRQFPGQKNITQWECSCKWGDWAFKRQITFVGRFCSHALAVLYAVLGYERSKDYVNRESSAKSSPTVYCEHGGNVHEFRDPRCDDRDAWVEWRLPNGYLHREDGPAIDSAADDDRKFWYLNGEEMPPPDWYTKKYAARMEDDPRGFENSPCANCGEKIIKIKEPVGLAEYGAYTHVNGEQWCKDEKGITRSAEPDIIRHPVVGELCGRTVWDDGTHNHFCGKPAVEWNSPDGQRWHGACAEHGHPGGVYDPDVPKEQNYRWLQVKEKPEGRTIRMASSESCFYYSDDEDDPRLTEMALYRGQIENGGIPPCPRNVAGYVINADGRRRPACKIHGERAAEMGDKFHRTASMTTPPVFPDEGDQGCDYGHRAKEVRSLPTGGDSNTLICKRHFDFEMWWRKDSENWHHDPRNEHGNPSYKPDEDWMNVKWDDLEPYDPGGPVDLYPWEEWKKAQKTSAEPLFQSRIHIDDPYCKRGVPHNPTATTRRDIEVQLPVEHLRTLISIHDPHMIRSRATNHKYTGKEWDENVDSVRKEGIREPLEVHVNDTTDRRPPIHLNDGTHRLAWAYEAGLETVPATITYFGDGIHNDPFNRPRPQGDYDPRFTWPKRHGSSRGKLTIHCKNGRDQVLRVEVAKDAASIRQGLMNRPALQWDHGMVFLHPQPPTYSGFWMMNTLIPLSIAFWDRGGFITEIIDMEPCVAGKQCPVYTPKNPYWGAVEVNRNYFKNYGITVGDRVELQT